MLIQHVTEDVIHKGLEHNGSIGETKRHDQIFIMANVGVEGGPPFVPFMNANQVVGVAEVELSEDCGPLQQIKG